MTGKEFKEYIDRTLQDDDIIYYIVIGRIYDPEICNLKFERKEDENKNYYSLHD